MKCERCEDTGRVHRGSSEHPLDVEACGDCGGLQWTVTEQATGLATELTGVVRRKSVALAQLKAKIKSFAQDTGAPQRVPSMSADISEWIQLLDDLQTNYEHLEAEWRSATCFE